MSCFTGERLVLWLLWVSTSFSAAHEHHNNSLYPRAPFRFAARSGGWQVNASESEVLLTWLASGSTWSSSLIDVAFTDRTTYSNNGCWKHEVKMPRRWAPTSDAFLSSGNTLVDGTVVLAGLIMSPVCSSCKVLVPANWTLALKPNTSGALAFNISVDLRANTSIGATRPGGASRVYKFSAAELSLKWQLVNNEQLVGAGEQYSMVGLRGEKFYIWSGEQGIGRGRSPITRSMDLVAFPCAGDSHTTYSAVPMLLSTRGYGLVLDNSQLISIDLTSPTASMTVIFENQLGQVSGHILGGKDIRSLLPGFTEISGRMPSPPSWMQQGLIIGAEGGYEVVQNYVDTLLSAQVPLAGVWIQDWSGKVVSHQGEFVWWNWKLDETMYPKSWFRNMSARGIKVLTYINPFLTSANQTDGRRPEVFLEAQRLGHLVKDKSGKDIILKVSFANFMYGMVDLFTPSTREWWTNLIRCNVMMACDDGTPLVHAWMHDYGEYFWLTAFEPPPYPQGVGSDIHNLFPRYSAETARKASDGLPDVTFFTRSGGLHSPGMSNMFWLGDQLTTYDACDGLQSALIGSMSGGMSGWTINHADIGAFTMITRMAWLPIDIHFKRDMELNVRWLELAVFINAIYRSHPGLLPKSSSQLWDQDVLPYTKRLTNLFRDMAPYRNSLFNDATTKGLPLVRHGILVEPEDSMWFNASQSFSDDHCKLGNEVGLFQFYFGDDVIVAPALRPGVASVFAYIPKGEWIHFWSRKVVQGPSYKAWEAPLGQPAFFFRLSSTWADFFARLSESWAPHAVDQAAEDVTLV